MVSLIPGSETRNHSSRGETVLGMLGIGDMSSVCQRIYFLVKSLMPKKEINWCIKDS